MPNQLRIIFSQNVVITIFSARLSVVVQYHFFEQYRKKDASHKREERKLRQSAVTCNPSHAWDPLYPWSPCIGRGCPLTPDKQSLKSEKKRGGNVWRVAVDCLSSSRIGILKPNPQPDGGVWREGSLEEGCLGGD